MLPVASDMVPRTYGCLDVDSSILARGTPGFSGADLHNMVKCERSVIENTQPPTELILVFFPS